MQYILHWYCSIATVHTALFSPPKWGHRVREFSFGSFDYLDRRVHTYHVMMIVYNGITSSCGLSDLRNSKTRIQICRSCTSERKAIPVSLERGKKNTALLFSPFSFLRGKIHFSCEDWGRSVGHAQVNNSMFWERKIRHVCTRPDKPSRPAWDISVTNMLFWFPEQRAATSPAFILLPDPAHKLGGLLNCSCVLHKNPLEEN